MNSKIYFRSSSKSTIDRKKYKEGKKGAQTCEYHENKKVFLDETKTIFYSYLKAVI